MKNRKTYRCSYCNYAWMSRLSPKKCPACKNELTRKPKNKPRRMYR